MIKLNGKKIVCDGNSPQDKAWIMPDTILVSYDTYQALADLQQEYDEKRKFKKFIDKKIESLLEEEG